MKTFHLGTTNNYKVREFAAILSACGCDLKVTAPIDPDETEDTFEGNALLKARVYAAHAGGLTISEDSGLLIPALDDLPGPWSARFADCVIDPDTRRVVQHSDSGRSREEIDAANNTLVLKLMRDVEQPHRAAMFKSVMYVCQPNGDVLFKGSGEAHGWIATEARGRNGFGYDPIFVGHDTFGKTYAELDSHRKNLKSHRRKMLQEFQVWLAGFLRGAA